MYRPVFKTWRLNERAYGALTGLREDRCKAAVGADTWWRWRMSLRARPPPLSADHPLAPHRERKYADVPRAELPTSESLQDCLERALPLWHERVAPDLKAGRNVLVVAHGNSLRGLVKARAGACRERRLLSTDAVPSPHLPTEIARRAPFSRGDA